MELRIQFVRDQGDGGVVHIHKLTSSEMKKIGEIKYSDEQDRRWLVAVLTERHPNVAVIE